MRAALLASLALLAAGVAAAQVQVPREAELQRVPDAAEMERLYPASARTAGKAGRVELECTAQAGGAVTDCAVMLESPAGYGFGDATLQIAPQLRIRDPRPGVRVRVPLAWRIGGQGAEVVEALSPIAAAPVLIYARSAYYPREAEAAKVEGRAVVECLVMSDYRVTACAVLAQAPEGQGFGEAALRRVSKLTVRPTRETGPTAGRKVRFPVFWRPVDSRADPVELRPDGDLPERKVRRGPIM